MALTKARIAESLQNELKLSQKESMNLLEEFLSIIKTTIKSGEGIKISGFGNFEVKHKKDRKGRNPATGETITIEARKILTFKVSNVLRNRINH